jgi:hypothetical protein
VFWFVDKAKAMSTKKLNNNVKYKKDPRHKESGCSDKTYSEAAHEKRTDNFLSR